jgi:hypothetical protein
VKPGHRAGIPRYAVLPAVSWLHPPILPGIVIIRRPREFLK